MGKCTKYHHRIWCLFVFSCYVLIYIYCLSLVMILTIVYKYHLREFREIKVLPSQYVQIHVLFVMFLKEILRKYKRVLLYILIIYITMQHPLT